jgi:hypothetical protein
MRNGIVFVLVAIVAVALLLRFAGLTYMIWRVFHDSEYPWWIEIPAAVALTVLFWMLGKRYRRGRFDGPF